VAIEESTVPTELNVTPEALRAYRDELEVAIGSRNITQHFLIDATNFRRGLVALASSRQVINRTIDKIAVAQERNLKDVKRINKLLADWDQAGANKFDRAIEEALGDGYIAAVAAD
jgi:hypothetical protein